MGAHYDRLYDRLLFEPPHVGCYIGGHTVAIAG